MGKKEGRRRGGGEGEGEKERGREGEGEREGAREGEGRREGREYSYHPISTRTSPKLAPTCGQLAL